MAVHRLAGAAVPRAEAERGRRSGFVVRHYWDAALTDLARLGFEQHHNVPLRDPAASRAMRLSWPSAPFRLDLRTR